MSGPLMGAAARATDRGADVGDRRALVMGLGLPALLAFASPVWADDLAGVWGAYALLLAVVPAFIIWLVEFLAYWLVGGLPPGRAMRTSLAANAASAVLALPSLVAWWARLAGEEPALYVLAGLVGTLLVEVGVVYAMNSRSPQLRRLVAVAVVANVVTYLSAVVLLAVGE